MIFPTIKLHLYCLLISQPVMFDDWSVYNVIYVEQANPGDVPLLQEQWGNQMPMSFGELVEKIALDK